MENKIEQRLKDLFVSYSKNLPNKINALQMQWQTLCENFDVPAFKDFHREVHNLTGSAGTYGFTELSKAARELEMFLKLLLDNSSITKEEQSRITQLTNKMLSTGLVSETDMYVSPLKNESRVVCLLEEDERFAEQIKLSFLNAGYNLIRVKQFDELLELVANRTPVALIVNTDYLDAIAAEKLGAIQHQNDIPTPLFAISSHNGMSTRLRAVRAGSSAFFNKPVDIFYLTKMIEQMSTTNTMEQFRILIVDDSASLAEYYAIILQNAGMVVKAINDPLLTMQVVIEFKPDLLLLDVYMPSCSGIELASVLRQDPKYMHIPIVFLSSEEDKFKQLAALNLGGDDFLTKPILPQHLVAAVRLRAKRAGILSTFIKQDSLTGLLNHSTILHQLDVELSRADRNQVSLSFVMLDIDHFKKVNDQFGHVTGDRVLRKLSELLLSRLRKTDSVGRYGGEEFAIILPNTSLKESQILMEELRKKIAHITFNENGVIFTISFSAGIAEFPTYKEAGDLIEAADQALYRAKQNGRNQITGAGS